MVSSSHHAERAELCVQGRAEHLYHHTIYWCVLIFFLLGIDLAITVKPGVCVERTHNTKDGDSKQYDQEIGRCTRAIESNPGDPKNYAERAEIYRGLGIILKAIDDYAKAIELDPAEKKGDYYYQHGELCQIAGRYQQAIGDYSKLIQLNPKDDLPYEYRSRAYERNGQFSNAIADLTKMIESEPKNAEFYFKRGTTYARHKQFQNAIPDYSRYL